MTAPFNAKAPVAYWVAALSMLVCASCFERYDYRVEYGDGEGSILPSTASDIEPGLECGHCLERLPSKPGRRS